MPDTADRPTLTTSPTLRRQMLALVEQGRPRPITAAEAMERMERSVAAIGRAFTALIPALEKATASFAAMLTSMQAPPAGSVAPRWWKS